MKRKEDLTEFEAASALMAFVVMLIIVLFGK
jgi:hypothetical protein